MAISGLALAISGVPSGSAQYSGFTTISASIDGEIALKAPESIGSGSDSWQLQAGDDNQYLYKDGAIGTLTGSSNNGGFQVTAIDQAADAASPEDRSKILPGHMRSDDLLYLAGPLRIVMWDDPYAGSPEEVSLESFTPVRLISSSYQNSITKYISWKNLCSWSDVPQKSYSITIKFSISDTI